MAAYGPPEMLSAIDRGDAAALHRLGATIAAHRQSESDALAVGMFFDAICKGFVESAWELSMMLLEGRGCAQNVCLALRLVEWAAHAGSRSCCGFLAHAYRMGLYGLVASEQRAAHWARTEAALPISLPRSRIGFPDALRVDVRMHLQTTKPGHP